MAAARQRLYRWLTVATRFLRAEDYLLHVIRRYVLRVRDGRTAPAAPPRRAALERRVWRKRTTDDSNRRPTDTRLTRSPLGLHYPLTHDASRSHRPYVVHPASPCAHRDALTTLHLHVVLARYHAVPSRSLRPCSVSAFDLRSTYPRPWPTTSPVEEYCALKETKLSPMVRNRQRPIPLCTSITPTPLPCPVLRMPST
jgi:hypothetical protein